MHTHSLELLWMEEMMQNKLSLRFSHCNCILQYECIINVCAFLSAFHRLLSAYLDEDTVQRKGCRLNHMPYLCLAELITFVPFFLVEYLVTLFTPRRALFLILEIDRWTDGRTDISTSTSSNAN